MANWEYKVLSSGKHGMATMAALEQHLNDLGQQQWEIINWHTAPDNPLLFTGLARRPILRDWKPEEMPAAVQAAKEKAEDDKERNAWRETLKEELEFVTEQANELEEDPIADTEDLLDMLFPMLRPSKRGEGTLGATSFLSRRLNLSEEELLGALAEAGIKLPENPDELPPAYEYEDDYYWLKKNDRGEIWLNVTPRPPSKQEPKPERVGRHDRHRHDDDASESGETSTESASPSEGGESAAPAATAEGESSGAAPAQPAPHPRDRGEPRNRGDRHDRGGRDRHERGDRGDRNRDRQPQPNQPPQGEPQPLPEGEELLRRLRPMMRRNRRGRGLSGSISYLSRALRHSDADLSAALAKLGLVLPEDPQAKPVIVEIADLFYWLNRGQGGQIWINTREKRAGETAESARAEEENVSPPSPTDGSAPADGQAAPAPAADGAAAGDSSAPASNDTPTDSAPVAAPTGESAAPDVAESPDTETVERPATPSDPSSIFARIRPHFSKNKRSASFSAQPGAVADALGVSQMDLVETLVKHGLEVPDREDSKPVFAEFDGEIFWFNRNAKDELWLNAKAKAARRGRSGAKKKDDGSEGDGAAE